MFCSLAIAGEPMEIPGDDPEYLAAVSKARSQLPQFWERFSDPAIGEEDFSLKISIGNGDVSEEFWVTNIERDGEALSGTIDNESTRTKNVAKGTRVSFKEEAVEDWMFLRNGNIVGNYTLRVFFRIMSDEEVEGYKRILEEL